MSNTKYEKTLCFLHKNKKVFYKINNSDTFILFESNFINITSSNYSSVETVNLKHYFK